MESVITVLIFLAVISLSIYLTYYSADTSSSNRFDKILTFCLPFISTLVIGIAVINKFIYLPIVITVALIAGVVSLLVSWSAEKKAKEAKQRKNHLYIFYIYMFKRNMNYTGNLALRFCNKNGFSLRIKACKLFFDNFKRALSISQIFLKKIAHLWNV